MNNCTVKFGKQLDFCFSLHRGIWRFISPRTPWRWGPLVRWDFPCYVMATHCRVLFSYQFSTIPTPSEHNPKEFVHSKDVYVAMKQDIVDFQQVQKDCVTSFRSLLSRWASYKLQQHESPTSAYCPGPKTRASHHRSINELRNIR